MSANFTRTWVLAAAAVLVLAIVVIQLLRVNAPKVVESNTTTSTYTPDGALVSGEITIAAHDFFKQRINLNRRARITGSYRTPSVKSRVSISVIGEQDLDRWVQGLDHKAVLRTGYVPGGKINGALDPGSYLLLIDNRVNDLAQSVTVDFVLE